MITKAPQSVLGIQANTKKELAPYLKRYWNIKIVVVPKPKWWSGKWNKLFAIYEDKTAKNPKK